MNVDSMKAVMRITKALADRQRVRILMMLAPGELCVCQIVEVLALAPSTVSKHLSILDAAGLVEWRKDGRWAYYRLAANPDDRRSRSALNWIRDALRRDDAIAQDTRKLRRVVACDPETLTRRQRPSARTGAGK